MGVVDMFFWILVNICVSLFLIIKIRTFALTFYLLINYVMFIQPGVVELLFGVTHPKHILPSDVYHSALIFTACFNLTLGGTFAFFQNRLPLVRSLERYRQNNRIDRAVHIEPMLLASVVVLLIASTAKWILHSHGTFRMSGEVSSSPFLQLCKVIAVFDLFLLTFIGEFKARRNRRQIELTLFYFLVAALTAGLALLTGSRAQVATIFVIVLISHRSFLRRHFLTVTAAMVAGIPFAFILFPFLAYYRQTDYDLDAALGRLSEFWADSRCIMMDVVTTRLNYFEPVSHAMAYVDRFQPAGGAVYWNNFLGLIPRLLWAGKPQISNDSQILGHTLGLVTANDTSTSIGLRPIGEAYFELAWLGLAVAVVQGLAFAFLHRQFAYRSSAAFCTVYIYTTIYIVSRDGFFAVLPGLVYVAIGFFFFFGIMTLMLPRPTRLAANLRTGRRATSPG